LNGPNLTDQEYAVLRSEFGKRLDVVQVSPGHYSVSARQYVGNVNLPAHAFIIEEANDVEGVRLLTRTVDPTKKRDEFEKECDHFVADVSSVIEADVMRLMS